MGSKPYMPQNSSLTVAPVVSRVVAAGSKAINTFPSPTSSSRLLVSSQTNIPPIPLSQLAASLSESLDPGKAEQLIELLQQGHAIESKHLYIPITKLCASGSKPLHQKFGYRILAAYLSTNSDIPVLEKGMFWNALCAAGPGWVAVSSESRSNALHQFVGDGSDLSGLDNFLESVKDWASSAASKIATSPRDEAEKREQFVDGITRVITKVTKSSPTLLSDQYVSGLIEMYGGWVESGELPCTNQVTSVTPTAHAPWPFSHHRSKPSIGKSSVLPTEPEILTRNSMGATMFTKLIQSYLEADILLPISILPRVTTILCTSLGQTMSPLVNDQPPFLGSNPQGSDLVAKLLLDLANDKWYSATTLKAIKAQITQPTGTARELRTAAGAMRSLRLIIHRSYLSENPPAMVQLPPVSPLSVTPGSPVVHERGSNLLATPWSEGTHRALQFERITSCLGDFVDIWLNRDGGDDVLLELAGIVHDLLGPWDSLTHPDVSRLSGEIIVKLSTLVEAYRHADGSVYKLRLPERNVGPTPLLRAVGDLLRRPLETTTTNPPLASVLLDLDSHLVDGDVVKVITYLQETRQLAPSCPDWLRNVRKLINCFYRQLFPRCRRAIAAAIAELYRDISDLEVFRMEIVEDVVSMWERTLPDEPHEDTIEHAWEVLSRELVLSTAAQEDGEESPIAQRIRNTWVAVARNSPCYYDSIYSSFTPSLTNSTLVTSPNVHLRREYPLTPPQMGSEPGTPTTERINSLTTIQPRKAILAVTLLINAFNTLAFSSPQSLTILLDNADRPQSVSSALTALELFSSLVGLLSPATPPKERVHCPKARLVILSWLLRLRADREHRVFAKPDLYDETLALARLIWRAERPKMQTPPLAEIQGSLAEKRRNRTYTRGNIDPSNSAASRDAREGGRKESRVRTEHLVDTISRSRSRPPINPPRTPPVGNTTPTSRPVEMLWALPEKLCFELGPEAQRPSPAMTTYESTMGGTGTYWLPVSSYIAALCEILVNDKDWEIVSYVLVHLPLQLSNKHFFCGPKAKEQMRRLIRLVSTAINEDRLAHNMDVLQPVGTLTVVDVQGLLYHTLMVCISYHNIFDISTPVEGMKSPGYGISDLKSDILEVIVTGLARDEVTNTPCLEALSLAVYELPAQLAKFTSTIVEKLSQIMSNPNMAVHILELLVVIGYSPKLWSNSFRQEDYRRVFGVALKYIEHHNRPDIPTLRTTDGRDSFSLAQHVLNTAYTVIYQWFSFIRITDRPTHVPFITEQLLLANRHRPKLDAAAEVCFDWLARYTYGNADPKPALTFLYQSIVAPSSGEFTSDRSWVQQTRDEMENTMILKAWKLGNAIITISTMKKPKGWIRMQARRPSGITELVCRVENWPLVTLGDVDPDFLSLPATLLSERPVDGRGGLSEDQIEPNGLVPESEIQERIHRIFEQPDVIKDVDQPDPISGYVWSGIEPSQRRKEVSIDPSYVALMLSSYPANTGNHRRRFKDVEKLKGVLSSIDTTPVTDTHKVGIVYVAPGQTTEQEILANSHGSPAYSRFLADLGRVIKPSNRLEVYTGGLAPARHGDYAYAWWDDISQVIYHVATIMPNLEGGFWKKQEIGNDGVKIIWNDGGTPFALNTINSQFSLINILVEPHSIGSRSAYSDNQHENEFFKITLQTSPKLPRVTPIGEFKIVSAELLPLILRHFSLLASLFASTWERTGRDSDDPTERIPLLTNWQQRLRFITNSERQLTSRPPPQPHPPGVTLMEQEAGRDFTSSF